MHRQNKQMTYEEHGHGCIVLVTSSDPKIKIKILKSKIKTSKTRRTTIGKGILNWW